MRTALRFLRRFALVLGFAVLAAGASSIDELWSQVAADKGAKPAESAPTKPATIVKASDGDTIKVRLRGGSLRDVRLIGIDTPETVRPGSPVECGGAAASRHAERFVGQSVRLVGDATQDDSDRYGRLLRYAVTEDGVDIGKSQLANGLAAVYVYERPFRRLNAYRRASERARAAGRGTWTRCGGQFTNRSNTKVLRPVAISGRHEISDTNLRRRPAVRVSVTGSAMTDMLDRMEER